MEEVDLPLESVSVCCDHRMRFLFYATEEGARRLEKVSMMTFVVNTY
jgi:hypothetical protein